MNIFLDTNIIVDLLDTSSYDNRLAEETLRLLRLSGKPLYISPVTLAITFYIFTKRNRAKVNVRKTLVEFFAAFRFTEENQATVNAVLNSSFSDLEDALQYYSAKQAGMKLIITKNKKDFVADKGVTILHPEEFIAAFYG